jgi:uncharacterized tellurite resistance protein B-like protein
MLIFGTRNVRSTVKNGTFFCPVCKQQTEYKHITNRNFGHLFFIPLLPLGGSEEYIECQRCGTPFGVEVLSYSPQAEQSLSLGDYHKLVLACMQLVAAIDASVSSLEVQTIRQLYQQVAGEEVDGERMRRESERLRSRADEVYAEVARFAPTLGEEQKEVLIRTLILVAFSDNQPQQIEYDCLAQVARNLGVTEARLKELIPATIKIASPNSSGA